MMLRRVDAFHRGGLLVVVLCLTAQAAWAEHRKPSFLREPILVKSYNGADDDLLTAGLGKTGLQSAVPPLVSDPNPSAAELRRRAIHSNYRALVDTTPAGGFGVLYGPNIDNDGKPTLGEGKIAGDEYLAYADDGSGRENVTMLVQVPASFDPQAPCIVAAPSSGSRGVYGAIATAGEWGLKRGCAVAYTDKGTGNGVHDLASDTVTLIDGRREAAASAGARSHFTAKLTAAELVAFNAASPNRLAVKHAHSEQNPERDWGEQVIQSVRFAFYVLNEKFGARGRDSQVVVPVIRKARTIVIASSVSNGGGASLRAAERDLGHWIDGIAVAEPNVQPFPNPFVSIERDGKPVAAKGRALYDYFTSANLLQACAAWAPSAAASPGLAFVVQARASNRCAALKAAGLINGDTFADQAADALAQLRAAGWEPESDLLHASHYAFATPAVAVTYAKTYGRASVADSRCGFSFAATGATGGPAPVAPIVLAQIFGNGNGIPPMGAVAPASGINIVNDNSLGGPLLDSISFSPKGVQDFNTDGAFCLRSLFTGTNADGSALAGAAREAFERTRQGIREVRATGFLFGKPAIIVHGRADTLVPVNHSSRPYYASNRALEGRHSGLRYYEITNAQHFDAFLGNALLAGYDTRFVPLHRYFVQAMDLMWHHLKQGAPLPPSQVVRTVPRGGSPGAAPAITAANVPPIVDNPTADNLIKFANRTLSVPE